MDAINLTAKESAEDLTRVRVRWIVSLGWFVFFILWTLFILGWGGGDVSLGDAARGALITTCIAAVLSVFVWRITGRLAWPDSPQLGFVAKHLLVALLFSVVWTASSPIIGFLLEGMPLSEIEWNVQTNSWRLFMGVWLYFIVAGLSYAARTSARLQHQRQLAARAEALAAKARLSAMRSQLHPHFLFNALHSVSALIETAPVKATDAMEMLGDLLRYAIRDRDSEWVDLREEWQFVSDYVDMQRLRFGTRIKIHMQMQQDLGSARVPAFSLQPLVENAFVHGLDPLPEGGQIWIEASRDVNLLELSVQDDGVGLDASTLNGSGSGLANLRLRLSSLYGNKVSVEILPREGGGTRALIRIEGEEL